MDLLLPWAKEAVAYHCEISLETLHVISIKRKYQYLDGDCGGLGLMLTTDVRGVVVFSIVLSGGGSSLSTFGTWSNPRTTSDILLSDVSLARGGCTLVLIAEQLNNTEYSESDITHIVVANTNSQSTLAQLSHDQDE